MSRVTVPTTAQSLQRSFLGGLLMFAIVPMLFFAACSSGGDGGPPPSTTTTTPPPAGGSNQFAYVINFFGPNVQAFTSDSNGNFTPVGNPMTTGTGPHNVNVDKAGRFVYISNHDSNFVSGYTINSATGSLTPINQAPGSPVTNLNNNDSTDNNPHWSVFDTTGAFLYVIAGLPPAMSTLKSYQINADGTLTQIGTTGPLAQCSHGHNVTITPNNKFIYVACEDSAVVYTFQRGGNGAAVNPGVATQVTAQNGAPATAPSAVVDSTSSFLFVGVTDGVTVFNIDPNTGNISGQTVFVAGNTPHNVTVAPNGDVYTANINNSTVSAFSVNAGALTQLAGSPFATGGTPNQVVAHPDGQVLFTADQTTSTVTRFTVNADGTLTRNGNAATLPGGSGTNGMGITNK
jgi:6-phosphogluconolactonase (cycloisomerase 2 family)